MKYLKPVIAAAAAITALAVVPSPSPAAEATTVAVNGTINVSGGLSSTATLSLSGTCAGASAGTQSSAGAGTCNITTGGTASGNCTVFQGSTTGTLSGDLQVAGPAVHYSLNLWSVRLAGGAVTIEGTATSGSGPAKAVVGTGVAYQVSGSCGGPATFAWNGSITITG